MYLGAQPQYIYTYVLVASASLCTASNATTLATPSVAMRRTWGSVHWHDLVRPVLTMMTILSYVEHLVVKLLTYHIELLDMHVDEYTHLHFKWH